MTESSYNLRERLILWVEAWQREGMSYETLRDSAEDLLDKIEPPAAAAQVERSVLDRSDPELAAYEVLSRLASLHIEWITRDDAPAILDFLIRVESDPVVAWDDWLAYWNRIDWEARGRSLTAHEFFAPFVDH